MNDRKSKCSQGNILENPIIFVHQNLAFNNLLQSNGYTIKQQAIANTLLVAIRCLTK